MADAEESPFDCRAPQFYDSFSAADDDGAEKFFDLPSSPRTDNPAETEEFFTPLQIRPNRRCGTRIHIEEPIAESSLSDIDAEERIERRNTNCVFPTDRIILKARRRSLQPPKKSESVKQEIDNAARIFEGIRLESIAPEKEHTMTTRQDVVVKTPKLSLRNREVVRLQMKRAMVQSPSAKNAQPPVKYMAMAEQVYHYFKDTPPRFRKSMVNPRQLDLINKESVILTVPQSPVLLTKARNRSPSPIAEKTVQFKAQPLNPKIFQKPDIKPTPKPPTVLRPFNLTEVHKKEPKVEEVEAYKFKARPAPDFGSSRTSSTSSIVSLIRVPMKENEGTFELPHLGVRERPHEQCRKKVEPFSFAMRDRQRQLAKMKKIQEILEAEAKIPQFVAQPLPSFISSSRNTTRSSHGSHHEPSHPTFKAKPATVLHKSPFLPEPAAKPPTKVTAFELNTEKRARERSAYDKKLMENQKANELLAAQLAMERERKEKEELARLRSAIVHKAKPVPSTSRLRN